MVGYDVRKTGENGRKWEKMGENGEGCSLLTSEEGDFHGTLSEEGLVQLLVGKGHESRTVDRATLSTESDGQATSRRSQTTDNSELVSE